MLPIFPPLLPLVVGPLELALAFALGWLARGCTDQVSASRPDKAATD
jgi:hypothetical protein